MEGPAGDTIRTLIRLAGEVGKSPAQLAFALVLSQPEFTIAISGSVTIEQINEEGILQTIYFDYDESEVRADQRAKLQANAQFLRDNTHFRLVVAGHCDERGTREYNMALGERRASATMQYLVSLGVPASRIDIISYGEENPAATESNEDAWAQNRRAQFHAIDSNDR